MVARSPASPPGQITFPRGRLVRLPKSRVAFGGRGRGREASGSGRGRQTSGTVSGGFVRISEAPPGAPTLLLLHGWTATADINWAYAYGPLAEQYGLIAPDLHGHGRGPRRHRRFRLEECAHDVAALTDYLGVEKVIVVGYSMGGTVAQMMWRHHPELVDAMVLCATAGRFEESLHELIRFAALGTLAVAAAILPRNLSRWIGGRMLEKKSEQGMSEWALGEMYRHEPLRLLQAGRELGKFDSRAWLGAVDVPVASVITAQDEVVSPQRQRELASLIGAQDIFEIAGGHTVCLRPTVEWPQMLLAAVDAVAQQSK